jgi:uncharacterized membrane protein
MAITPTPSTEPEARAPVDENIKAVATLERAARDERSRTARISDSLTAIAGSDASILLHAAWFIGWLALNSRLSPFPRFDPFPYNVLTAVISIEAVFLALVVIASQNRLTREARKREHLDLQVNLLAEREMTVVLRMLQELCERFDVTQTVRSKDFQEVIKETDVHDLAHRVKEGIESGPAGGAKRN